MSVFALTFIVVFMAQILSFMNFVLLSHLTGFGPGNESPNIPSPEEFKKTLTSLAIIAITTSLIAAYTLSWIIG